MYVKKAILFMLVMTLVFTMLISGCDSNSTDGNSQNNQETEDNNTTEENSQNNQETNNDQDVENEPLYRVDPPVEMQVIKPADTFFGYTEEQTVSDNVVYDIWEETVGIKFVNKVETSTEAIDQQVKLAILSDDLPDVIAASAADFDEMIRNDMLVDLSDYIDKYMDPEIAEKLNAFDGAMYEPVKRGDEIYGIPATSNVEGALRTMWIRKDYLEAVDRDIPTTMEEVIELAIAFTKEDPNGTGEDDTFGLPIDKDITTSLLNTYEIIANAHGYYPTRRLLDDEGDIELGSMDSGLKDILKILQDLYKEGAIDPEFTSKDFMQIDEDIATGKYGLWLGVFWKPVDPGMQTTYQEGVEWIAAPIPASETVDEYRPFVQMPVSAYYGIRKDYEHPEALIAAVNQYLTVDYQMEGGFQAANRRLMETHPELTGIPLNNWAVLQWQDPLYFSSSPIVRALDDPDFDPDKPQYPVHGQAYEIISGRAGTEEWVITQFEDIFIDSIGIHESYPTENYVFDAYFGAPTETMREKGSILEDLELETVTKIITGDADVSEYDDFIAEYMELGGSDILVELNTD